MKKTLVLYCFLIFQIISISAQIKIDGKIDSLQDTIYLNERVQVDYYSNEFLRDGFADFPVPQKTSDSLYEYSVCGGPTKGPLYLGCASFRFKKPGINIIPKIYYNFNNLDTIWSNNQLSVYVLNEILDEKLIFRKKYLDRYIEDSLTNAKIKRFSTIVDSMSIVNCSKSKPYLRASKDIFRAKVNQEFEIDFSTNYLCLSCENYIISDSDTASSIDPFVLKMVDCLELKTNLEYNKNDFVDFESIIERSPAYNEWDYFYKPINLKEIQNNFNKFGRVSHFKIKLNYRKPGIYRYKVFINDSKKNSIVSKNIKVIIGK